MKFKLYLFSFFICCLGVAPVLFASEELAVDQPVAFTDIDSFVKKLAQNVLKKVQNVETSQQTLDFLKQYQQLQILKLQEEALKKLNTSKKKNKKPYQSLVIKKLQEGLSKILTLGAESIVTLVLGIIFTKIFIKSFPAVFVWTFSDTPALAAFPFKLLFKGVFKGLGAVVLSPVNLAKAMFS